jgi:hypothetical protein
MKRIHVKPKPLPRIARIALCVLAAAVLLFVVYAVSGYPAFSPEQALRRAERRALISMHGEVLACEPQMLYNSNNTRLLAVEYGDVAAGFYGISQNGPLRLGWGAESGGGNFLYLFPKSADGVTVAACPGYPRYMGFPEETLVIAAFDDVPEAVRAELSFTLAPSASLGYPDAAPISYALSAEREHEGVFLFSLATPEEADKQSSANYLLERLAECVDPWSAQLILGTFADGAPPVATVVFYDASGNAVATIETAFARALV